MQRYVKRWLSQGVGRAFESWLEFRKNKKRVVKLQRKVLARWRGDMLEVCFEAWSSHAAERSAAAIGCSEQNWRARALVA